MSAVGVDPGALLGDEVRQVRARLAEVTAGERICDLGGIVSELGVGVGHDFEIVGDLRGGIVGYLVQELSDVAEFVRVRAGRATERFGELAALSATE